MYDILFTKTSNVNSSNELPDNEPREDNVNNINHNYIVSEKSRKKSTVTTMRLHGNEPPPTTYKSSFRSMLKSLMLTSSLGGAQFCFTSILSYGRPHLESIGFSDEVSIAMLLLVPMCGLVCQPVIGSYSDRCGTRIGSRTPFLLGVCVLTAITSFMFSCSPQIAASIVPKSNPEELHGFAQIIAKFLTVTAIVGSGIAQDVNNACSRSLLVDKVPFSQQPLANALAAISSALGSLASYAVCSVDLPEFFGTKKFNQLHSISLITSIVSLVTVFITVIVANEGPTPKMPKTKWYDPLKEIIYTIKDLPSPIRTLCNIQFFSYLPWYPILFFSSTWVEQNTLSAKVLLEGENGIEEKISNAREATIPLVVFSFASLLSGLIVPMIVPMKPPNQKYNKGWSRFLRRPYKIIYSLSSSTPKVWAYSHVFLFLTLCITPIRMGFYSCLLILALVGYCWGIFQWIPFVILSELLIKLRMEYPYMLRSTSNLTVQGTCREDMYPTSNEGTKNRTGPMPLNNCEVMIDSGAVFGVHNVYIVMPQLLSAIVSLGVTHYVDVNYKSFIPVTAGWCMLASSPGALVAAYLIMKKIPKLDAQYGIYDGAKESKPAILCTY